MGWAKRSGRAYFGYVLSYLGLLKELISFWSFRVITDSAEEPPSRGSGMWQGCHNTSINNSCKACAVRADFSPLPGCGMPGVPLGKEISQFQVLSWERLTLCILSLLQTGYRDLDQTCQKKCSNGHFLIGRRWLCPICEGRCLSSARRDLGLTNLWGSSRLSQPLGMPVRNYLHQTHRDGKTHSKRGTPHSLALVPRLRRKERAR